MASTTTLTRENVERIFATVVKVGNDAITIEKQAKASQGYLKATVAELKQKNFSEAATWLEKSRAQKDVSMKFCVDTVWGFWSYRTGFYIGPMDNEGNRDFGMLTQTISSLENWAGILLATIGTVIAVPTLVLCGRPVSAIEVGIVGVGICYKEFTALYDNVFHPNRFEALKKERKMLITEFKRANQINNNSVTELDEDEN